MRARVSCTSGWSRIAQLPAGERHEDVLQRGMVGGEERELGAPPLQEAEQRGDGAMHLGHREGRAIERRAHRAHARQCSQLRGGRDRKSTRLNSSHEWISYAVFCLKKKNTKK